MQGVSKSAGSVGSCLGKLENLLRSNTTMYGHGRTRTVNPMCSGPPTEPHDSRPLPSPYSAPLAKDARSRLPEKVSSVPHREHDVVDLDTAQNKRRKHHPRAFDKPENDRKHIRLLMILLPRKGNKQSFPIECYFTNPRRLDSKLFRKRAEYKALSYTWGPGTHRSHVKEILINNERVCV